MNTKSFYNLLLTSSICLVILGAASGCYYILKSKEIRKIAAIERARLSYLTRPAYQFKTAIMKNDVSMAVELLQQEQVDLNHPNCKEHTSEKLHEEPLLIEAVRFNRLKIVKEMLKNPLNLYTVGQTGRTAIEESIFLDNKEMLDILLQKAEIDINQPYHNTGETLLHLAIFYKAEQVIKYLLEKGANPMSSNEQGTLAIDYLPTQEQKDILLKRYQLVHQQKKVIQEVESDFYHATKKQNETPLQEESPYQLKINAFMKMVEKEPDSLEKNNQ